MQFPEANRSLDFDPSRATWTGQSDVMQHVFLTVRGTHGWQLEELGQDIGVSQDAMPHHTFKNCLKHPDHYHNLTVRFDINPHLVAHSQPNRRESL
jgi:hypothetical protein